VDVLRDVITTMRTGRPHSSRSERSAPWRLRPEPFAGAGFHVVLRGSCLLLPERGDPVPLAAGDVVCLLPHAPPHGLADAGAPAELLCGAYQMDPARAHPLLAELPGLIHLPAHRPELRAATDLLDAELSRPGPGTAAAVPALLDLLLLYILRAAVAEHAVSGWVGALADPAVGTALRRIHRSPGRMWTVADLAGEAGLSRAAFARRFTTLVGRPPLAYLTWWRMTTAARLLREGDLPVRSVAARAGYTSEFAFTKAFKRELGVPPNEYRFQSRPARAPNPRRT
jgi:AraC-like DNA-binding protein